MVRESDRLPDASPGEGGAPSPEDEKITVEMNLLEAWALLRDLAEANLRADAPRLEVQTRVWISMRILGQIEDKV